MLIAYGSPAILPLWLQPNEETVKFMSSSQNPFLILILKIIPDYFRNQKLD